MNRLAIFLIMIMVFLLGLNGCGYSLNQDRKIECTKPAIQIANMSNSYSHCKGLSYE